MRNFVLSLIVGAVALIGVTSAHATDDKKVVAAREVKAALCNLYRQAAGTYLKHQVKLHAADIQHEVAKAKVEVTTNVVSALRNLGDVPAQDKAAWQESLNEAIRNKQQADITLSELQDQAKTFTELVKSTQRTAEAAKVTCPKMPDGYPHFGDEVEKPASDTKQLSQATSDRG